MLSMIGNNISTIVISALLMIAVVMIIRSLYRNRKEGKCFCGCSGCERAGGGCCGGCSGGGSCCGEGCEK